MDKPLALIHHLEELRRRIILSLVSVFIFSIISYLFVPKVIQIISRPVGKLILLSPTEGLFVYLKITLILGLFFSSPVILYQIWQFISIAFKEKEKKTILLFFWFSCFLFILGVLFGYFLLVPFSIKLLLNFASIQILPVFSLDKYISFVFVLIFITALIFELPCIVLFLTKLGIVTPAILRKNFKYAILGIFIIAAIITPTTDIFTQCALAFPMLILYELSIWLAKIIYKNK